MITNVPSKSNRRDKNDCCSCSGDKICLRHGDVTPVANCVPRPSKDSRRNINGVVFGQPA